MNVKTVYIEITNRCNLNCKTCYNRSGLNRATKELSINDIESIMSIFSKYGAKRFLFSGGEPTLHSDFDALIELIKRRPDLSFGFVTNGSSRNEKFIELLNTRDNITLQISLDGSTEEQNAKTRGEGHFDMAMDFVKMINNQKMRPLLKMVISKSNLSDVESFYRLAVSVGCVPEFAFIYKSGNAVDGWEDKCLSAQEKVKILKLIDSLNLEYGIDAYLPRCTSKCPFAKGAYDMSVCVKTDGSVQPCQALYSNRFTLTNALAFNENEFKTNVSELLCLARKRTTLDFGCGKCMLKSVCGRGCMAEAANLTGDPLGSDDGCLHRKLIFLNYDIKKQDIKP